MTVEGGSGIFEGIETQGADPLEPPVAENVTANPDEPGVGQKLLRMTGAFGPGIGAGATAISSAIDAFRGDGGAPTGARSVGQPSVAKTPINRDSADYATIELALTMSLFNSSTAASSPFQRQLITQVADHVYRNLDEQDPALIRYISESVNQAAQLEDLRNGVATGEVEVSGLDFELGMWADGLWETGASQAYVWSIQDRGARTISNLDALRVPFDVAAQMGDYEGVVTSGVQRDANATGFAIDAEGNMAVTYRFGEEGSERTLVARGIDPNVDINNQVDLWAEVRRAAERGDLRREDGDLLSPAEAIREANPALAELGEDIRDRPWAGLVDAALRIGSLFTKPMAETIFSDAIPEAVSPSGDSETPFLDRVAEQNAANARAFFEEQADNINRPTAMATVMLANLLQSEAQANGVEVSDSEALATARQFMSPEEFEEAGRSWKEANLAVLLEQAEQAGERVTASDAALLAFDESVQSGLDLLETWDDLSQFIGANVLDYVYDGVQWVADPTGRTEDGLSRFEEFRQTVDWGVSAAEEFDIDPNSSGGQALNMGVSILFDPTNLIGVGAGGKAVRKITSEALSDARFADAFIDMPQMRRVVSSIADTDIRSARIAALELEGFGIHSPRIWRLAADPKSTRAEVIEAVKAALPSTPGEGSFIGFTPGWTAARNQALGVARVVENYDTLANTKFGRNVINWLAKGSADRSIPAGDIDQMVRTIRSLWGADEDAAFKWMDEYMTVVENHNMLSSSRRAEMAARIDELEQAERRLGRAPRMPRTRARVPRPQELADEINKLTKTLREMDEAVDPAARQAIEDQIRRLSAMQSDSVAAWKARDEQLKPVRQELRKLQDLAAEDQVTYLARAQGDVLYRMWDEAAEKLNEMYRLKNPDAGDLIPIKMTTDAQGNATTTPMMNRLAPSVPVRDWSNVSHTKRALDFSDETQLALSAGLAGDDPAAVAATMALNPFARLTQFPTPVSTAELLTAFATGGDMALLGKAHGGMMRESARQSLRVLRSIWGMNVLFNPITPIKTTGDESVRALLETGSLKVAGAMQLLGTPGVGRLAERYLIKNADADSLLRGIAEGGRSYQWLNRTKGKWTAEERQHVARFINGTILNSEMMQTYLRASVDSSAVWIDDAAAEGGRRLVSAPPAWTEWWERTGRFAVRNRSFTRNGVKVDILDPNHAYEEISKLFDFWLANFVDESHRGAVRTRMVEAITKGKGDILVTGDDARFLNYIKRVPANLQNDDSIADKMFGSAWEFLYGAPSRRRGAYYTQHEFEYAMDIYRNAYSAKNGKVLITAEELMKRGMSPEDAHLAIRQGASHPAVRQALNETGGMTERQLEMAARRWANQRSRDLAFDMTAGSALGRAADNPAVLPYVRAQGDFIDWWMKYMSRPLTMGKIGPEQRAVLAQHPALAQVALGAERWPGPVNFGARVARNYAHAQGVFDHPDDGKDPSYVERALDELTFLPGPWNESPISRIVPTPGFVASAPIWMLEGILEDENGDTTVPLAEAIMDRVWPMLNWAQDADIFDYFLPNGRRSVRNMVTTGLRSLSTWAGMPVNTQDNMLPPNEQRGFYAKMLNFLEGSREPLGASTLIKAYMGEWLRDNAFAVNPGSETWLEQMAPLVERGIGEANLNTGSQDLARWAMPLPPAYNSREAEGIANYDRLLADEGLMRMLVGVGVVQDNLVGGDMDADLSEWSITQAHNRYLSGEASKEDIDFLYNALSDTVFRARDVEYLPGSTYQDLLLVQYPELAANIVSTLIWSDYEPTDEWGKKFRNEHITPEGYLHDIPPGAEGREMRTRALEEGIVVYRPPLGEDGYLQEAHNAVLQSAGRLTRSLWQFETGKEWSAYSTNRTDSDTGRQVSGLPAAWRDRNMELSPLTITVGNLLGLNLPTNPTFQDFREILQGQVDKSAIDLTFGAGVLDAANLAVKSLNAHPEDERYGAGLVTWLRDSFRNFDRNFGITRFSDMPTEDQEIMRAEIAEAMNRGYLDEATYNREWSYIFGPDPRKDHPVTIPERSQLSMPIIVTAEDKEAGLLRVVDGDTVELTFPEDGETLPIRIIGLGAPERMVDPAGHQQAYENLRNLIDRGGEITFGLYDESLFGTTQMQGPDRRRILMWMFVDGVPIVDRSLFTVDDPTARSAATVSDLEAIYQGVAP